VVTGPGDVGVVATRRVRPIEKMTRWMLILGSLVVLAVYKSGGDRVHRVALAISVAEGYGVPNAIPTVRNNPGNIRSASGPIAYYPTIEAGWEALYKQVRGMLDGTSRYYPAHFNLEQVAKVYTGEAAYMNWARIVADKLGVATTITFSRIV
jgi:hypothetical protein